MTESTPRPTPDECERIMLAALKARDFSGVVAALMVMAPQDPDRAHRLVETLQLGLDLALPPQP